MRKTLMLIHLLIAGFVAPAFILVSISGGLYLLNFKGEVTAAEIALPAGASLNFESDSLNADVRALLEQANIDYDFEYIKNRGTVLQTRPTSRRHIQFKQGDTGLTADWQQPNFQAAMMELHKGHGPNAFRTYQKFVAIALFVAVLSGVWMGLMSPALRRKTLLASGAGLLAFLFLALG